MADRRPAMIDQRPVRQTVRSGSTAGGAGMRSFVFVANWLACWVLGAHR